MSSDHRHKFIDGPDGEKYHCRNCGISKCQDWAGYNTCEAWRRYKKLIGYNWDRRIEWKEWRKRKHAESGTH